MSVAATPPQPTSPPAGAPWPVTIVAAAALLALVTATVVAALAGWRVLGVVSDSMLPTLARGDAVTTVPIRPAEAEVGGVITFADPTGSGRLLTHRVVHVAPGRDLVAFETRGDAATVSEHWTIPVDGRIHLVRHRLPLLGHAIAAGASPTGRLVLLGLPAAGLLVVALAPARAGQTPADARSAP